MKPDIATPEAPNTSGGNQLLQESLRCYIEVCKFQANLLQVWKAEAAATEIDSSVTLWQNNPSGGGLTTSGEEAALRSRIAALQDEVQQLQREKSSLTVKYEGMRARWLSAKAKLEEQ